MTVPPQLTWRTISDTGEQQLCSPDDPEPRAHIWYEPQTGWHLAVGGVLWPVPFTTDADARAAAETQIRQSE